MYPPPRHGDELEFDEPAYSIVDDAGYAGDGGYADNGGHVDDYGYGDEHALAPEAWSPIEPEAETSPFNKMMGRLRRVGRQLTKEEEARRRGMLNIADNVPHGSRSNSSAGSSCGFVTTTKTASLSVSSRGDEIYPGVAEVVFPNSESEHGGHAPASASESPEDPEAMIRSNKRRHVLWELLTTEDNFISDMQFLIHTYKTILSTLPNNPLSFRISVTRNLEEISELHSEILEELRRVVPQDLFNPNDATDVNLDGNPAAGVGAKLSWTKHLKYLITDAQIAAEAARVFTDKIYRFSIYHEYSAKYEAMLKDIAKLHRSSGDWEGAQKSLELMASSTKARVMREGDLSKKSMTLKDLAVKPIQRICRYSLLFGELLRATPVQDCPNSHTELETVLARLKVATRSINSASKDNRLQDMLERTWALQNRLVFPDHVSSRGPEKRIRKFGNVQLCGALHVCWQDTLQTARGECKIIVLYNGVLCIAVPTNNDKAYTVQACINVEELKVVGTYEGLGLQCRSAPHSWTLLFENGGRMYELLMTACSYTEACAWINGLMRLRKTSVANPSALHENFLSLDILDLGPAAGERGTAARRLSIQQAMARAAHAPIYEALVKCIKKEGAVSLLSSGQNVMRSRSLPSTPVLASSMTPSRRQRTRFESILADVWSREALPLPGIFSRSKSTDMIRRLSVVSIGGSFSRRSTSTTSTFFTVDESDGSSSTPATSLSSFENSSINHCRLERVRIEGVREDLMADLAADPRGVSGVWHEAPAARPRSWQKLRKARPESRSENKGVSVMQAEGSAAGAAAAAAVAEAAAAQSPGIPRAEGNEAPNAAPRRSRGWTLTSMRDKFSRSGRS